MTHKSTGSDKLQKEAIANTEKNAESEVRNESSSDVYYVDPASGRRYNVKKKPGNNCRNWRLIKFENDGTWYRLNSEEDLLFYYPEHVWGTYRPQPYWKPDRYPCLFHEVATLDNSNGPDHAMLAYIYDFEETNENDLDE